MKFKGKFVYTEGDKFLLRLVPAYQRVKREKGIKDKRIYCIVESRDKIYLLHSNAFFIFVDKNKLQEDELEYVRGKLKEAYDMRYHVVSR